MKANLILTSIRTKKKIRSKWKICRLLKQLKTIAQRFLFGVQYLLILALYLKQQEEGSLYCELELSYFFYIAKLGNGGPS